uniref:Bifunctional lysine-specific demethylase and histidyl-hydroxylase n=4 Tax=Aegilops tauschii TaxID=37682 RepID=A0A453D5S7_AEGTS
PPPKGQHGHEPFTFPQSRRRTASPDAATSRRETPGMENPDGARKKKRRRRSGGEASASFDRDVFPILLAAVTPTTGPNQRASSSAAAAARLLRRLLSRSPPAPALSPLPGSLVALLPLLLSSSSHSVAALSCEVMGAAALQSMEAAEALASDGGVAGGLARALGGGSQRVAEAACNAVMDLSASPVGRERLSGSPVLPRLLYLFSQVESISRAVGSGSTGCQARVSEPSKCLYLIVDTVVLMVNSCKVGKLHNLQQELVRKVTLLLYEVWSKVRLLQSSTDCTNWKDQLQSRPYEISEAIFRLTMDLDCPAHLEPDEVRKSFFGQTESDVEKFALMYWENSPYSYRKRQSDLEGDDVFTALHNAFDLRTPDAIVESFIRGLVSCPAIASDELNIDSFLDEVHDSLGAPVKYRQDVRVVRTRDQTSTGSGVEEHFFDDGMVFPDGTAFVEQCKDAIKNGFSIALRGMEFRSEKVAAIASALADLFGQPSVGANIYFSPPGSQGLARHYDDHCVLVWQLLGRKKWKMWPNTKSILPRLYEPFHSLDGLVDDSGGRVEVLHEGDIMYVPRGHVHEAHTDVDEGESEVNVSTNYSLHLTLAIEVEPPFEWEGFVHIALHCWLEEQELVRSPGSVQSKLEEQAPLFALLLHVAIRLLSDNDPTLRKACMVAAKLPSSETSHPSSLQNSQRSTFAEILNRIGRSNNLKEALRLIELAVKERNEEPFQWMSWLRHLPQQQHDGCRRIDFCDVLGPLEELLDMFSSDRERASADFADFKSRFCSRAVYDDACREFEALLVLYRTARTRYAKGMLALHGKHGG